MQQINVNELISHPRNTEFFDDMDGDKWKEFLESVKSRGIIEPVVVTQNKMIVSGHQRVRACKELGIESIICKVQIYDNEDQILQDLLETNIRQRGDVGGSAKKVGLRIKELERLYGIREGSAGKRSMERNNYALKTQEELSADMGMDVRTLQNYKRLAEMIPELEELVDTGIVTKTTALAMMKNLSPSEQKDLIATIPSDKKYTQTQMDAEIQKYKNKISELVQQGTKTEVVTKEVDKPETIEKLSKLQQELNAKIASNTKLSNDLIDANKKISQAIGSSTNYQLTSHCSEITKKMLDFVRDMAQYDYMAESFNEIPNATRVEYEKCIRSVKKWADRILETINTETTIVDM